MLLKIVIWTVGLGYIGKNAVNRPQNGRWIACRLSWHTELWSESNALDFLLFLLYLQYFYICLDQELANIFYKGTDGKYSRLPSVYGLCCKYCHYGHRLCMIKWEWLCFHMTLFTKIGDKHTNYCLLTTLSRFLLTKSELAWIITLASFLSLKKSIYIFIHLFKKFYRTGNTYETLYHTTQIQLWKR